MCYFVVYKNWAMMYNVNMNVKNYGNKKIGVAVSGGADSMVLLTLLRDKGYDIKAINIDHSIRGAESASDSAFVAEYCKSINVELLSYVVDVPKHAKERGISLETSARMLRYDVFFNLLNNKVVDTIALAHHASDQTETILMRLFRGTGIRGLRGIADRDGFIHPLLKYTKKEILDYAVANNIPWVTDSTNAEDIYTRNFLRNKVVPVLEQKFDNIDQVIYRMTDTITEVEDYMMSEVTPYEIKNDTVELPLSVLDRHPAIAKKSIMRCFYAISVFADIQYELLNNILNLKHSPTNSMIDASHNAVVIKGYTHLIFAFKTKQQECEMPFSITEKYKISYKTYSFERADGIVAGLSFDLDKVPPNAVVRTRKVGDKFKRYGGGSKSLSDYLTDIKMPLLERQNLLVLAVDSTILAILGKEISDHIKIDKETKNIFKVRYEI